MLRNVFVILFPCERRPDVTYTDLVGLLAAPISLLSVAPCT
jgi:hypothetical protein